MNSTGGTGWGLLALAAVPFCCGSIVWLATAGLTTSLLLTWAGWGVLGALALFLTVGVLLWRQRTRADHGP